MGGVDDRAGGGGALAPAGGKNPGEPVSTSRGRSAPPARRCGGRWRRCSGRRATVEVEFSRGWVDYGLRRVPMLRRSAQSRARRRSPTTARALGMSGPLSVRMVSGLARRSGPESRDLPAVDAEADVIDRHEVAEAPGEASTSTAGSLGHRASPHHRAGRPPSQTRPRSRPRSPACVLQPQLDFSRRRDSTPASVGAAAPPRPAHPRPRPPAALPSAEPNAPPHPQQRCPRPLVAGHDLDQPLGMSRHQLLGRPRDHEAPAVDDAQARAALGLLRVGRGHDDGDALGGEAVDDAPQVAPRDRIDTAGGLVEQQHLGAVDQRADQGDSASCRRKVARQPRWLGHRWRAAARRRSAMPARDAQDRSAKYAMFSATVRSPCSAKVWGR